MNKIIYLTAILFLLMYSKNSIAQSVEARIALDEEAFNFGKIEEQGGSVEHRFVFTNTGAKALVITNVKASCGCTTPNWSKNPVPPGGKGFVSAIYNPLGRPGAFNKSITVTSNAENSPNVIHINGNVIAKQPTIEEKYRYAMDGVRLGSSNVHFQEIYNNETKTLSIKVINTLETNAKITFNEQRNIPAYITIVSKPEILKANEEGEIIITYDASKKNDWDYVYDRLYLSVNGTYNPNNRITVSAVIKEKFTEEQLKNPPAIEFLNETSFDFGSVKQGEKIEYEFKFKNTGKSDLIIRKTKTSCGCTASVSKDKVIKPGQESSINAVFNTRGKRGKQTKTITVITNIPGKMNGQDLSRKVLIFKGNVEVPK